MFIRIWCDMIVIYPVHKRLDMHCFKHNLVDSPDTRQPNFINSKFKEDNLDKSQYHLYRLKQIR